MLPQGPPQEKGKKEEKKNIYIYIYIYTHTPDKIKQNFFLALVVSIPMHHLDTDTHIYK